MLMVVFHLVGSADKIENEIIISKVIWSALSHESADNMNHHVIKNLTFGDFAEQKKP